jgi:hypothetical protein
MNSKFNLVALIGILLLSSCALQKGHVSSQCKTDLEKEKINGNVKQIITTGIYSKDGAKEINHIKTTEFNKNGKALGYTFASKYNELQPTKTIYEFDEKGNKIVEKRYNLKNEIKNTLTYRYDSVGNVIESIYYLKGNLDSYTYYTYNSLCEEIGYKAFLSDSTIWLWYTFTYEDGNIVSSFDEIRSTVNKSTYNDQGNCIKTTKFDKEGNEKSVMTYVYEYDKKWNWTKKTTYDNGEIYWIDERQFMYY